MGSLGPSARPRGITDPGGAVRRPFMFVVVSVQCEFLTLSFFLFDDGSTTGHGFPWDCWPGDDPPRDRAGSLGPSARPRGITAWWEAVRRPFMFVVVSLKFEFLTLSSFSLPRSQSSSSPRRSPLILVFDESGACIHRAGPVLIRDLRKGDRWPLSWPVGG